MVVVAEDAIFAMSVLSVLSVSIKICTGTLDTLGTLPLQTDNTDNTDIPFFVPTVPFVPFIFCTENFENLSCFMTKVQVQILIFLNFLMIFIQNFERSVQN